MKKFAIVLLVLLTSCSTKVDDNTVVIIDGDYAEMNLAVEMAKLLIEEYTEYNVYIQPYMAYNLAFDQVRKGEMDILPSYDGTLLATYLQTDPSDVPKGMTLYDYANELGASNNVKLLEKWGHQNTYVVATRNDIAEKHHLTKISDLVPLSSQLRFAAEHSFFDEEGSVRYRPFTEFYGLNFASNNSIDVGLKYAGLDSNNMDVTLVNGSDGMNLKYDVAILEDDQNFFPEYYMAYLVRADLENDFPGVEEALNKLAGRFSVEIMIQLNYEVDVMVRQPRDVAREYLLDIGLID